MHISRNRRDSYLGGSSLVTVPPKAFERGLAITAENLRQERHATQLAFDRAREGYRAMVSQEIRTEAEIAELRRNWTRVEEAVSGLRRECAFWRTRAQKAEAKLLELTQYTG